MKRTISVSVLIFLISTTMLSCTVATSTGSKYVGETVFDQYPEANEIKQIVENFYSAFNTRDYERCADYRNVGDELRHLSLLSLRNRRESFITYKLEKAIILTIHDTRYGYREARVRTYLLINGEEYEGECILVNYDGEWKINNW